MIRQDYGRHRDDDAGPDGYYLGFPYRWARGILQVRAVKGSWTCRMSKIRKIIQTKVCLRYRGFLLAYGEVQYLGRVEHTSAFRAEKRLVDRYWEVGFHFSFTNQWPWATKPGFVQVLEAKLRGKEVCRVCNQLGIDEMKGVEYADTDIKGKDIMVW
jgi:hypothetical protein